MQQLEVCCFTTERCQSVINVQLRKLETELKIPLFMREGKGMSVSTNGESLLLAAQQVLAELTRLQLIFKTPQNVEIRVGIPDDFDEGVLERSLADFTQTNPDVEVLASSGYAAVVPDAIPDAIHQGDLDIAVCPGTLSPAAFSD